jgi:DNA polymerase
MPPPEELFAHIAAGGLIEAWNCSFEWRIWRDVCVARMGWPDLPFWQLRDAMAKARAYALPGALAKAAEVTEVADQKLKDGKRLIDKFSCPRKPTKKDPRTRIRPEEDPADAANLYTYNIGDIKAESAVSALIPDLPPEELDFWLCTQAMNIRGIALDMQSVNAGVAILDEALERYNAELVALTNGTVSRASEVQKLTGWLGAFGVHMSALDDEAVTAALARDDIPAPARRAMEIRQLVGSAGVKKLYAMQRMATRDGRACDMFVYHRARTGRDGGADIQPQNLTKAGPKLRWCGDMTCEKPYGAHLAACPHCGADTLYSGDVVGWSWKAVDHALEVVRTGSLDAVEQVFGNALLTLSGCIRGLFTAAPGHELLCSDFSSIEAVVTAVLAGEEWRIQAFRDKKDIYLESASGITGTTAEEYAAYYAEHGEKHSDRQKYGKPAELGLGFGGWIGAWRQFDKSGNFTDDEVKAIINAWREASPGIVELWGGQVRGKPWNPDRHELFGLEGAAIAAVQDPGQCYEYGLISFGVKDDALFCRLPSGRLLTYHRPRLAPSTRWDGQLELTFEGYNSNPKMGPIGWVRLQTYGGRLAENVIQATARDIMRESVINLERAGYPIVLRVHDELAAEVPLGFGSVEEFERIMQIMPAWAEGWPVRAAGGWRGNRYRKD